MGLKIRILGSGTSTGVPEIGCKCPVCTSTDVRDKRLRTSAMVYTDDATILLDCGPDFRQQMLTIPFQKIDAVLLTHEHYDHVGGLDDLRPFCRFGSVLVYAESYAANRLRTRMPYCFTDKKYPGVPDLILEDIHGQKPFSINGTAIIPFRVFHGKLPILGYRIGDCAYITDMLTMPADSYELLKGLDLLIINALRIEPHLAHQTLSEAIKVAEEIKAKEVYFVHMSHHLGLYEEIELLLPHHMHLAYDGMNIEVF